MVVERLEPDDARLADRAEPGRLRRSEDDRDLAEEVEAHGVALPDHLLLVVDDPDHIALAVEQYEERRRVTLVHDVLAGAERDVRHHAAQPLEIGLLELRKQRDDPELVGRHHGRTVRWFGCRSSPTATRLPAGANGSRRIGTEAITDRAKHSLNSSGPRLRGERLGPEFRISCRRTAAISRCLPGTSRSPDRRRGNPPLRRSGPGRPEQLDAVGGGDRTESRDVVLAPGRR